MKYKILLTGATGFVGSSLFRELASLPQVNLVAAVRVLRGNPSSTFFEVGPIDKSTNYSPLINGVDVVVHAAARAHVMKEEADDPLSKYRLVNVDGTLNLARQAAVAGVKRFIFISSIGVNGNVSTRPFTASDQPNPVEPYALSKWEAEQGLWKIQQATEMEVVIIRPPLIYGTGAPGNFGRLVRWIEKGTPLPLGAIHNKRSLISIDNLVNLIIRCIDHPAAANQVFLAGDGEDLSTTDLLLRVGVAIGKPAKLIPVPIGLLKMGATLFGKRALANRLLNSLQVDVTKTCELLDWTPPYTVEEGLRRCFEPSH